MISRSVLCALLLVGGAASARAQVVVQMRQAGPGDGPRMLAQILDAPYRVIGPGATPARIPRDSVLPTTTIVLGRDVYLDGTVHGDLVVIDGDLYTHPSATIDGRAIAYGGGVYESALGHVGGGVHAYGTFTYAIERTPNGYALSYHSLIVRPPSILAKLGPIAPRLPTYDRSNGLSIPVAAIFEPLGRSMELIPQLTYRSQLGRFDPAFTTTAFANRRTTLAARVEHGTFSNETWIWSDIVNSVESILLGDDSRNWYRATRIEAIGNHTIDSRGTSLSLSLGGRWERGYDARPDSEATGGPWSLFGRHEVDDMLRPNPRIDPGSIISGLGGANLEWTADQIVARLAVGLELGHFSPDCSTCLVNDATGFAQTTIDGRITFPTFSTQTLSVDGHAVVSALGQTPRQRWAYVGGPGTIPTLDMLERGGDELVFVDGRYNIPIDRIELPFLGSPVLTLRQVIGGADVRRMPDLALATGVRVALSVLHVDLMVDPAHHRGKVSAGLSFAR